jgi:hypothetical protein
MLLNYKSIYQFHICYNLNKMNNSIEQWSEQLSMKEGLIYP